MKFIAFATPTIHPRLIITDSHARSPCMAFWWNPKPLNLYPLATTNIAARICITSLSFAGCDLMSSRSPIMHMSVPAKPIGQSRLAREASSFATVPGWIKMSANIIVAKAKNIPTPPRRGMFPLWFFLASEESKSLFLCAKFKIIGIVNADRNAELIATSYNIPFDPSFFDNTIIDYFVCTLQALLSVCFMN